jgi:hypothetical protein
MTGSGCKSAALMAGVNPMTFIFIARCQYSASKKTGGGGSGRPGRVTVDRHETDLSR